jgi:hypothetical protein
MVLGAMGLRTRKEEFAMDQEYRRQTIENSERDYRLQLFNAVSTAEQRGVSSKYSDWLNEIKSGSTTDSFTEWDRKNRSSGAMNLNIGGQVEKAKAIAEVKDTVDIESPQFYNRVGSDIRKEIANRDRKWGQARLKISDNATELFKHLPTGTPEEKQLKDEAIEDYVNANFNAMITATHFDRMTETYRSNKNYESVTPGQKGNKPGWYIVDKEGRKYFIPFGGSN